MPAAAVEAFVDDEGLLAEVVEQVALELLVGARVHGADVQVADLAAGELVHHGPAAVHPAVVLQVGLGSGGERLEADGPGAVLLRLGVDQELEFAAGDEVEQLPVVVAGLERRGR